MELGLPSVGAAQLMHRRVGTQHVLIDDDLLIAQILGPHGELPHQAEIGAELRLRIDQAEFHGRNLSRWPPALRRTPQPKAT